MESSELALYRGLGSVRNYGVIILIAFFTLNAVALRVLYWIENNDLQNELVALSEQLPIFETNEDAQITELPSDVIVSHTTTSKKAGFYEISINNTNYLAYTNPEKKQTLMKSTEDVRHEIRDFIVVIGILYLAELIILLSWWFFLRSKIRNIFEMEPIEKN